MCVFTHLVLSQDTKPVELWRRHISVVYIFWWRKKSLSMSKIESCLCRTVPLLIALIVVQLNKSFIDLMITNQKLKSNTALSFRLTKMLLGLNLNGELQENWIETITWLNRCPYKSEYRDKYEDEGYFRIYLGCYLTTIRACCCGYKYICVSWCMSLQICYRSPKPSRCIWKYWQGSEGSHN